MVTDNIKVADRQAKVVRQPFEGAVERSYAVTHVEVFELQLSENASSIELLCQK